MGAHERRARLWANTRALHSGLRALGFTLATEAPESAIVAVMMPDQVTTARIWSELIGLGVYVNMARPPATPAGTFLLRTSLCAEHTPEQVERVLAAFEEAAHRVGLGLQKAA
jgi:7-keto-8-aminopelargonate synthetase-like enzyme